MLGTWHNHCTHKLTAAMVTCTTANQQGQSTFQQSVQTGLSGLLTRKGEDVKGERGRLRVFLGSGREGLEVSWGTRKRNLGVLMIKTHSLPIWNHQRQTKDILSEVFHRLSMKWESLMDLNDCEDRDKETMKIKNKVIITCSKNGNF